MAENVERKDERISVGYALPSKKVDTFIKPDLITYAKHLRIDFIPVDLDLPLLQQGPFHCLVHKIYDHEWNHQLLEFMHKHPNIPVIDSPSAIQRLQNRISMLDFILFLNMFSAPSVGVPHQIVVKEQEDDVEELSLKFPLIAKPLVADGSLKSHQMSLVFNSHGLKEVRQQAPVVLQEFINHGGVLFKVYVAGDHVKCVQRKSLPDINVFDHPLEGLIKFSQISNMPTNDQQQQQQQPDNIAMPPLDFVQNLAAAIRDATQLHLFNFDLIQDVSVSVSSGSIRYFIIDINYFPGYAKLPGFEAMLTDFFLDVVHGHKAAANQNK